MCNVYNHHNIHNYRYIYLPNPHHMAIEISFSFAFICYLSFVQKDGKRRRSSCSMENKTRKYSANNLRSKHLHIYLFNGFRCRFSQSVCVYCAALSRFVDRGFFFLFCTWLRCKQIKTKKKTQKFYLRCDKNTFSSVLSVSCIYIIHINVYKNIKSTNVYNNTNKQTNVQRRLSCDSQQRNERKKKKITYLKTS